MCAEQLLNDPALFSRATCLLKGLPSDGPTAEELVDEYLGHCYSARKHWKQCCKEKIGSKHLRYWDVLLVLTVTLRYEVINGV